MQAAISPTILAARPNGSSGIVAELYQRLWVQGKTQFLAVLAMALIVGYSYWPTLCELAKAWESKAEYSHGYLVPPFCALLLWWARDRYPAVLQPAPAIGGGILFSGLALRMVGALIRFEWLEAFSIIPIILGLTWCFGGARLTCWALPATLFLIFMIPMPYAVEILLGYPLQRLATICSTYILQVLGQPALAEGNTILIRDLKLGIVEACSGLRMLVTFVTFSTAVCLVVKKPLSDKLCILLSAIPIALVVNVARIVLTGVMYLHVSGESAQLFFHDLAGWFMMPAALVCLWIELWVLQNLIVELPKRSLVRA